MSRNYAFDPDRPNPPQVTPAGVGIAVGVLILVAAAGTSFYTVGHEGVALVKRFGKVVRVSQPGLHFRLPFWIDRPHFVPTRRVLKEQFGFRTAEDQPDRYIKGERERDESLMLSGDLNVIDVEWVVQYRISDADKWLHRVRDPSRALRDVSEAVMRQIVGNRLGSDVLTVDRVEIARVTRERLEEIIGPDLYDMGVEITTVEMQDVTPPDPVKPAFNGVNEARQQMEQFIHEAERDRNRVIPRARGEALRMIAEAEGEAAERVNRAKGAAARFTALYEEYREAPALTRRRLYLEMIDEVLPRSGRLYVVDGHSQAGGPLPLLHLEENRPGVPDAGSRGGTARGSGSGAGARSAGSSGSGGSGSGGGSGERGLSR